MLHFTINSEMNEVSGMFFQQRLATGTISATGLVNFDHLDVRTFASNVAELHDQILGYTEVLNQLGYRTLVVRLNGVRCELTILGNIREFLALNCQ